MVSHSFGPLVKSTFVKRPNRFILICKLENGEEVTVHLPDPGRLKELLLPGTDVMLRYVDDKNRKTNWSAVLVSRGDGGWVSVNSQLPNLLAKDAVEKKLIAEFEGWTYLRSEFKKGGSRWDLLMEHEDGRKMVVEVKGVSLVYEEGAGAFPDAVTARGAKHVRELGHIAQEEGWEAALFFVAQRDDLRSITPARHIDPNFADAMEEANAKGVTIIGRKCSITPDHINMNTDDPLTILL
ncbi:DNA/RNA nuclease SfsA [Alteribacter aurantiacus]|uniref:DNA/RNA nuclease SfsA n=1 Tax=Alteribacter aurantiacus TaxID=254410 RepID=UPI000417B53A|nr:DNA/RNA nuclease SfsA [Alteribacter aurantiacus]